MLKFDFVTEIGKIDIKNNKNETLAKKRNDIYNTLPQKDKPKYNNILFLYIDAISHPEFIRAMKNTEKYSSKKFFYQIMKYHNFIFSPKISIQCSLENSCSIKTVQVF